MKITATPQPDPSIHVKIRLELEGVPDVKATPTITVRPHLMSINYNWNRPTECHPDGHWSAYTSVKGRRILKNGELSESSVHDVYISHSDPWVAHVINAYTPKTLPELETEPALVRLSHQHAAPRDDLGVS